MSYLGTVARQLAHEYTGPVHAHAVAAWHALTAQPVEPLGVVEAARLAAAGAAGGGADAGDAHTAIAAPTTPSKRHPPVTAALAAPTAIAAP